MKQTESTLLSITARLAVVLVGIFVFVASAEAARLTVNVSRPGSGGNKGNQPIANAQVCISSNAGVQTRTTNTQGVATFDNAPQGQLTLTATAGGFTGQSRQITMGAADRTESFLLQSGSGGPQCENNQPPPPPPPGPLPAEPAPVQTVQQRLAITSFDARVIRRTPLFFELMLSFVTVRTPGNTAITPTHYRVAETSNLSTAPWIPYQDTILFELRYRDNSLTAYGTRHLYLQVKTNIFGVDPSDVSHKALDLQPPGTIELRLEGNQLREMLAYAEERGFPLRTREISVTQSRCAGTRFRPNALDLEILWGFATDQAWEKISEVNLLELSTRRFTPFWRVKNIEVGRADDFNHRQTISGEADGDGFRVRIQLNPPGTGSTPCFLSYFPLRAIVLEGPAQDLAIDQAKRWKNAFPPN